MSSKRDATTEHCAGGDDKQAPAFENERRELGRNLVIEFVMAVVLSCSLFAEVKIVVDRNTGLQATPEFKFQHIPSPRKNDAGATAKLSLVVGDVESSSGQLAALTDGNLPNGEDQPSANFFFAAGTDGGRILLDLGTTSDVTAVNTYSWHTNNRGPQVYNLYGADGGDPKFNPKPDENTHPASCGWKLIATVDTRPEQGEGGGQYGVSISDPSGTVGKFRYLLFDSIPPEVDDSFGNTFFSEVDVLTQ